MKILNVEILNCSTPNTPAQWWKTVEAKPGENLIVASVVIDMSFNEYMELLAKDPHPGCEGLTPIPHDP